MALAAGVRSQAGVPGALRILEVAVEGGQVDGEEHLGLPLRFCLSAEVLMPGHHGGQRNGES